MCCSTISKFLAIAMPIFVVSAVVYTKRSAERSAESARQELVGLKRSEIKRTLEAAHDSTIAAAMAERNSIEKRISFAASIRQLAEQEVASRLKKSSPTAEIGSTAEAQSLGTADEASSDAPSSAADPASVDDGIVTTDQPNQLAWYDAPPQVGNAVHMVPVPCDPMGSFDESLTTVGESIVREAHRYVEQYVLDGPGAIVPDRLTEDWIRSRWLVAGKTYDKVIEMPSGTYHQAIVQLRIPERDRLLVREWSRDRTRTERASQVGFATAGIVALIGASHLLLGIFASRRKKTNDSPAA